MAEADENEQESPVDPTQESTDNRADVSNDGQTEDADKDVSADRVADETVTDEQVDEAQANESDSNEDTEGLEDTRLTEENVFEKIGGFANHEGDTPYTEVPGYEDTTEAGKIRTESQTTKSSIVQHADEGDKWTTNGAPAAKVGKRTV